MCLPFSIASTMALAQPLQRQAVDVADIAVGGLVDGRIGRMDEAVAEGDGDGVAVNLMDGLQALLEVARDGLRGPHRLLADERAQERRAVRLLDLLVEAALQEDQRIGLLVDCIGLLVADQIAEKALAVVQPCDRIIVGGDEALVDLAVEILRLEKDPQEVDDLALAVERPLVAGDVAQDAPDDARSLHILDDLARLQECDLVEAVGVVVEMPVHVFIRLAENICL